MSRAVHFEAKNIIFQKQARLFYKIKSVSD